MKIDKNMLEEAADAGVIAADRVDALWSFLQQRTGGGSDFRLAHVIYYLGGLIALSAMTLFVSLSWHDWAGLPMLIVALAYATIGVALTGFFLNREQPVPAGMTAAFAVLMTPLAVYSVQVILGWWGEDALLRHSYRLNGRQTVLSLATAITASLALWRYRLPILMLVLAAALWYCLLDVLLFLLQGWEGSFWKVRRVAAMLVGLLFITAAIVIDVSGMRRASRRRAHGRPAQGRRDYALWWYVVGVASFWFALTGMDSTSELGKFAYFCINLLLLLVGAILMRRVFALFAFIGILLYLHHLADYVFRDSLLFPVALGAVGLAILFGGLYWQRHEALIQGALRRCLPGPLAHWLDRAQGSGREQMPGQNFGVTK